MATSHQIINAAADPDLLARAVALGAVKGLSQTTVQQNFRRLCTAPITSGSETTCIAVVHDYAATVRAQKVAALPPAPGADPAAVLDSMIEQALDTIQPQE